MSETTDAVIGVWPSGFREPSLGELPEALIDEMTTVYPMIGQPSFPKLENQWLDNSDELKALPGATKRYHRRTKGTFSRDFRLAAEPLVDLMSWGTGVVNSSAASSAVNEVQTLDVTDITAGAYKLRDRKTGKITAELLYSATQGSVDTALEAIVGAGNVAVVLASEVYTITFGGALAAIDYPELELIVTSEPVGGEFVLATTVEGRAAGQYTHTIREPSVCILNPHSFPYAEAARCDGLVDSFRFFPGVVVNGAGFTVSADGFIALPADFLLSGKELPAATFDIPTEDSPFTPVLDTDISMWFGDDFTNTYKLAQDEIGGFSVKWNFNKGEPEGRISSLKTVPEFQDPQGGMSIDLSAAFKGGRSGRFYEMIEAAKYGYEPKLRIRLDPKSTPQRWIELDFNRLGVDGEIIPAGREQRTQMTLTPLSNSTDVGRFTLKAVTAIASYLQLAV